MTAIDQDAVVAAAHLVDRSGARSFQLGWDCPHTPNEPDDHTCPEVTWHAYAQYRGHRVSSERHPGPVEAAEALARRLLSGATCRCGRLATLSDTGGIAFDQPRSVLQEQLRELGLEMVSAKRPLAHQGGVRMTDYVFLGFDRMCEMCFQDWHESCPDHARSGTCCCGTEDLDEDDGEDDAP